MSTPRSDDSRVRRIPDRARYDAETIHAILDAALVSHVGLVSSDRPVVIPMLHGRDGRRALPARLGRQPPAAQPAAGGVPVCVTATVVDGLVFARSVFHHSMNYRSVVVLGSAEAVDGEEKVRGLRAIAEHLTPGRWDEVAGAESRRAAPDLGPAPRDRRGLGEDPDRRAGRRRRRPRTAGLGRGAPAHLGLGRPRRGRGPAGRHRLLAGRRRAASRDPAGLSRRADRQQFDNGRRPGLTTEREGRTTMSGTGGG